MRKGWRKTFTKQVLCKMLRLMNAAYYIGHIGGNKIQLLWRGCPCLCREGPVVGNETSITKHLYPGDSFHIRAAVVGQKNGTVPGVVHAEFVGPTNTSLSALQESQRTGRVCTSLTYTAFSLDQDATLVLTAENTTSTLFSSGFETATGVH